VLGVAAEEGELDPELLLEGARRLQLPGGVVDADRARATPGEPGGDITGAAAKLDRVEGAGAGGSGAGARGEWPGRVSAAGPVGPACSAAYP